MAERTGLEPATPCVTGRYSNQLNYRTNFPILNEYRQQSVIVEIVTVLIVLSGCKSTYFFNLCKQFRKKLMQHFFAFNQVLQ